MGNLGFQELILIFFVIILIPCMIIYFIYRYAKNKGRLQEMEKRLKDLEGR
jgi:hypothetical protein